MNQLLKMLNRWKTTSGILFLITIFFGSIIDFNVNNPEEMILGKWHAENDSTFVWEFYENGQHFTYSDDDLISERSWEIVNECEGETADNEEDFAMLEIKRGDNLPSQCYVVQGLNGVLTLLAIPQGRLLIFDRVEKWTDNYATEKATAHQDTIHTGHQVFEPVLPELRDKTIPLRLPSFLDADELTEPQQLYALVYDTPANRYSIQISVLPECNWNNFCIVGAVHGEDVEEEQQPENSQKVSLSKNIEGYFVESACNAYCSRAKLIWFENNIKYTVEQKAAPKQTMIWIANSAIESSECTEPEEMIHGLLFLFLVMDIAEERRSSVQVPALDYDGPWPPLEKSFEGNNYGIWSVSDESVCQQLQQFVDINDTPDTLNKYYYQTETHYFIYYTGRKPTMISYSGKPYIFVFDIELNYLGMTR